MPNPKRKHSKTRRDKRRTHDFLTPTNVTKCSNCGSPVISHRVCNSCGFYKGKLMVAPKTSGGTFVE